jgi:hypothetical protein
MSVIKITKNDYETFTLVTTPRRNYTSSSSGVEGSVKVFPRQSPLEKDTSKSFLFSDTQNNAAVDQNFDMAAKKLIGSARSKRSFGQSAYGEADNYLKLVSGTVTKATAVLDIERFTPTTKFTKYTLCKNNIKDMLMPFYRVDYPHAHWAYTNYNTLNFFTSYDESWVQRVPTSSVLLYPNIVDPDLPGQEGYVSGSYCLTGAFTFDFYVNPRYKAPDDVNKSFRDGTIFHLSSSYALSLVTGTLKDPNGQPDGFRLKLQLSHSADYPPSLAMPGNSPYDLVFMSDDNSLRYNNWHHVVVRWGTKYLNDGTGSFVIDGVPRGTFVIPSGTIMPKPAINSLNPDVLCIGNFYEGNNVGDSAQSLFFCPDNALRDGVEQLTDQPTAPGYLEPINYKFAHPLKAEIHDLTFKRYYLSDGESYATGSRGIGKDALAKKNVAFYLPPFFVESTNLRRYVGDRGGILQTPFFEVDGTTDDPFNVAMSFGVNGHYVNLENFTKDFSTGRFPRLLNLSGTAIDHTTSLAEANSFLYLDGGVAKRNLTVLPCDDGNFDPNYELLTLETLSNKYVDPNGSVDYSYINLDNLLSTASLLAGGLGQYDPDSQTYQTLSKQLQGFTPEQPGLPPGDAAAAYFDKLNAAVSDVPQGQDSSFDRGVQRGVPLTIYNRLQDPSSNQVTVFNISNLYYGRRIQPGTFMIRDAAISGSYGSVSLTLKDDSLGNLYRADCDTAQYTQSTVGNIFYDEGIVVIKSPHLYFFGKNQYEVSFKGVYNVYSTKYEVLAGSGLLNSSSNASNSENFDNLHVSGSPVDKENFVYISGLNFHDENMNVVAKANLAQPIIKREGDKILFKVAFDF